MIESYTTLAAELRHEIEKVKGSRFLATVAPVSSGAEAEALVARVRRERRDARHHCWAWRTGAGGDTFRSSDDGEPGGSAGRPILQQLEAAGVTDAACVVTRYFGGTKLGVGGLVRAYGAAAREALARAELRRVEVTEAWRLEFPYECSGAVERWAAAEGLDPHAAEYGASVRQSVRLPVARVEASLRRFRDATTGRGGARREGETKA